MPLHISNWLRNLADPAYGNRERCGLIRIDPDLNWSVLEIPNLSVEPNEFNMLPQDLAPRWNLYGEELVGVWHTHQQGSKTPSDKDCSWAPPNMRYWIVTADGTYEYDMSQYPPALVEE